VGKTKYFLTDERKELIKKYYDEGKNKFWISQLKKDYPNLFGDWPNGILTKRTRSEGIISKRNTDWNKDNRKELIIEAYATQRFPGQYLKSLPQFRGVSRRSIFHQAAKLGLHSSVLWSETEKKIVYKYAGVKPVRVISNILKTKGFQRSEGSVAHYINTMLKTSTRPDTYSLDMVAIGFKCNKKTVLRWIKSGLIKAKKLESGHWEVTPLAIARFIIHHPFELNGRSKPDIPWLVSLILEFKNQLAEEDRRRKGWKDIIG